MQWSWVSQVSTFPTAFVSCPRFRPPVSAYKDSHANKFSCTLLCSKCITCGLLVPACRVKQLCSSYVLIKTQSVFVSLVRGEVPRTVWSGDGDTSESSGLGSSVALQLRSLSVQNQNAGAYGALATTVQLKGFNLSVTPAVGYGSQGTHQLHICLESSVMLGSSMSIMLFNFTSHAMDASCCMQSQ